MFFFPTSCQEKLLRGNLLQPKAAFLSLWTPSCSPATLLAKTKRSLHVPMTLSHLQHSQPCSHLLAPRPCLAGTLLIALFGEAHSLPVCGHRTGTPLPCTFASQVQIQQPPLCRHFGKAHLLLPTFCSQYPYHLPADGAAAGYS